MIDKLIVKGAKQHNLKNIDIVIPKNKLVIFTGISGSGKSSLAFDTIYAEGQRRYVESLSSYARQFLGVMDKPDVESIEGLSPAISIDQKSSSHNPRSTVGTITEIYDYLRLLFARIGHPHCPNCNREIAYLSIDQIVDQVLKLFKSSSNKIPRFIILSPLVKDRKGEYTKLFDNLRQKGFQRVRIDGEIFNLDEDFVLIKTNKHTIEVVIDRVTYQKNDLLLKSRITDSIETALKLSNGTVVVSEILDPSFDFPLKPKKYLDHLYSERFACPVCNISLPEIEPRSFSFNSPHGACPTCTGLGTKLSVDPSLVLSLELSISEGAIIPFSRMLASDSWFSRLISVVALKNGFSLKQPLKTLSQQQINILLYGTPEEIYTVKGPNRYGRVVEFDEGFEGIIHNLERRYKETESEWSRSEIEKYMRVDPCPECLGKRLKKESLGITINEKSIIEISQMSIINTYNWVTNLLNLSSREKKISFSIIKEIQNRLKFLIDVGLDYLTIDRSAITLAGGETQRIRLASQIGSGLTGVLYILDEPSIGLHQRDNKRLIDTLKNLRDIGNSVIVVEHDREMMEESDIIFDFGPGAGEQGGNIIASGTPSEIKKNPNSITGKYLSGKKEIYIHQAVSQPSKEILSITKVNHHNLKNIDVNFPLGKFICITGVSGSGKSTLINDVLYHALASRFNPLHKERPGNFENIFGEQYLNKVYLIDQSPIGRTPRSNPATYTGAFTYIRDLFANTKEARVRGYNSGRFSFNVKGGRCEACQGEGQVKIEMQFLPDVYVNCEVCQGKRYNNEALEVIYKDKNIAEVLELTVDDAYDFFVNVPGLSNKFETLKNVGLGYIKLGQPAPTLSGGEAQRVKLASELSKRGSGKTLYLLDEPTTGLHFADLEKLLYVLKRLCLSGNTVVVIEHNLDVIKNADWVIDLGPEGGEKGGQIVAEGTPMEIKANKNSYTGQFLARTLQ